MRLLPKLALLLQLSSASACAIRTAPCPRCQTLLHQLSALVRHATIAAGEQGSSHTHSTPHHTTHELQMAGC